uniref:Uncharacterized protein n=1 Tax=Alexandrium monilatum TaxID=311494 RepID=A0A7S4RRG9_9DINO|mmetsp:Transcript_8577/g.26700  ORF Transcript_8577/g.26700 Transcript_8577/m.26700 type:complete len:318 (+) Transcript_8577:44-997(+)
MASDPRSAEKSVHIGWVIPSIFLALCFCYGVGLLGPALFALLFLPNLFGIHMLLSWQWAVAVLITELVDVPTIAPCIAAFGYCIVGCPYYILNMNMVFGMGIDLPDRVKMGWADWITSNLYAFSDESKLIVCEVVRRRHVTMMYKLVFLQFDLLCHLLPMLICLQRHAASITPNTIVQMGVLFLSWAGCMKRQHFQLVRPYETLQTWRLCLVPAPRGLTLREHMQLTYIMDPAISVREQKLGLSVCLLATSSLLFLVATGRHAIIASWLAWGGILPLGSLQTIYCVLIVTVALSTVVTWIKIFTSETRPCKQHGKVN